MGLKPCWKKLNKMRYVWGPCSSIIICWSLTLIAISGGLEYWNQACWDFFFCLTVSHWMLQTTSSSEFWTGALQLHWTPVQKGKKRRAESWNGDWSFLLIYRWMQIGSTCIYLSSGRDIIPKTLFIIAYGGYMTLLCTSTAVLWCQKWGPRPSGGRVWLRGWGLVFV